MRCMACLKRSRSSALLDGLELGADQLDPEALEGAVLGQGDGEVEAGLAAQGGQQGLGALARDDLGQELGGERLDVGAVGHLGVGHDGGGVGVDQDDLEALLAQGLAALGAGVVELAGLADDDRAPSRSRRILRRSVRLRHYSSTSP